MNSSLYSADAATHLKIVVTALLAAIAVACAGVAARISPPDAVHVAAPIGAPPVPVRPAKTPAQPTVAAIVERHLL
jgi:hypothetical protein